MAAALHADRAARAPRSATRSSTRTARTERRADSAAWPSLTPLIDVTFLLLIFFILAGVYATASRSAVQPPQLDESPALPELEMLDRVVVSAGPYPEARLAAEADLAGQAAFWQVGARRFTAGNRAALAAELREALAANPKLQVQLRADRRLRFSQVAPLIDALAEVGLTEVNCVATANDHPDAEPAP